MKYLSKVAITFMMSFFVALVLLALVVAPVAAQGADPSPALPVLDLTNLGALLANLRDVLLMGFVASPATVLLVSVLKRFHVFDNIAAERMAWIIGSFLFAVLLVSMLAGYEVQFRSFLSFVIAALGVLTGPGAAFLGAAGIYKVGVALNAPVIGFQRTIPMESYIDGNNKVQSVDHGVKYGYADNGKIAA